MDKIKIGKRAVDALKATGAKYDVWDSDIAGFCVRVGPTGGKSYYLKYRIGGGRGAVVKWGLLGKHGVLTPDQAREMAQAWAAQVAGGGDPAGQKIERRQAPTVAELMGEYLADHAAAQNKPATVAYAKDVVNRVICKDAIGRLKVADVSGADIARFHKRLSKTPTFANRAKAILSKAFSLAELWGYRPQNSNPCVGVKAFPELARNRFLSESEFMALGKALALAERGELTTATDGKVKPAFVSKWALAAFRLLIFTGARSGEIAGPQGLRWEWIDFEKGRADLPDSKTGRKPLMLPPAALEVLVDLGRPESGKGFVIRGGYGADPELPIENLKRPWGFIRQAAGLGDLRIHDLRHSFASVMVAGGASLPVIGALLGHSDVKTTARYAHLSTAPLRAASDQAGGRLQALLKGPKDGAQVVSIRGGRQ